MAYEYTKPRAPIAAFYKSPGPCYVLPGLTGADGHDPRSVHGKNPSWGFGTRHGKFVNDCSPGPVHYPDPTVTNVGKDGTPHWSLYSRCKDLTRFQGPPPGAYHPENAGPSASPRSPIYSFGSRTKNRMLDRNPAPNTYSLPSLLGKTVEGNKRSGPAFSQKGRTNTGGFSEDLSRTPGPGTYTVTEPNIYQHRGPLYSMTGRNIMPSDSTTKPGPGAHHPENVVINKYQSPRPSFGIRHSSYTTPLFVEVAD